MAGSRAPVQLETNDNQGCNAPAGRAAPAAVLRRARARWGHSGRQQQAGRVRRAAQRQQAASRWGGQMGSSEVELVRGVDAEGE